ncbi:MAG: carbonic anhydrase [Sneathiellaceae bacterium]
MSHDPEDRAITDQHHGTRHVPGQLLAGYRRFRTNRYPEQAALLEELAEGQAPAIMIIACADSRVDPATIFGAAPGELFVARNVANLVPPFDASGGYHGTSAAIEFAVQGLGVRHIVVMGHARCGGIAACLAAADRPGGTGVVPARAIGRFIEPWVQIAVPARTAVLATGIDDPDALQLALEYESIGLSIENLRSFPFIAAAEQEGRLTLHGAWFAIKGGLLHWRDPHDGSFGPVAPTD